MIKPDYTRGRIDDWINYWALVNGEQIIVCRRHFSGERLLVWPKKSQVSKYDWKPSQYGKIYQEKQPTESCFFAEVKYHRIIGTHRDTWDKLFAKKEFCMWEPKEPCRYFEGGRNPHYLAFYKVFKTNLKVLREDVAERGQLFVEIINKGLLEKLPNLEKIPVVPDDDFERRREKILSIVNLD